jgi:hypothetical protein
VWWAAIALAGCGAFQEPRRAVGGPLRIAADGTDQVLVLTEQDAGEWRKVEVWSFGAADMKLRWRREVLSAMGESRVDAALLGAHAGIVWVFANGIHGLTVSDGRLRWPADALRARNTALEGIWPKERRFFELNRGVVFTAADAGRYRIDPATGQARPAPDGEKAGEEDIAPAYYAPAATYSFQARGALFGDRWLGLADNEDIAALATRHSTSGLDVGAARRYQLWTAAVTPEATDTERGYLADYIWRRALANLRPAGAPQVFLQAGLLRDSGRRAVVRLTDPEGALVLHHDRIDEDAQLQLARVTVAGEVRWKTPLPLSVLQSVLPGGRFLVLKGLQYDRARPRGSDPHHTAKPQLASVDLASGAVEWVDIAAKR